MHDLVSAGRGVCELLFIGRCTRETTGAAARSAACGARRGVYRTPRRGGVGTQSSISNTGSLLARGVTARRHAASYATLISGSAAARRARTASSLQQAVCASAARGVLRLGWLPFGSWREHRRFCRTWACAAASTSAALPYAFLAGLCSRFISVKRRREKAMTGTVYSAYAYAWAYHSENS